MKKEFIEKMRTKLISQRNEILESLAKKSEEYKGLVNAVETGDVCDIASDAIDRTMLDSLGQQDAERLTLINNALTRIAQGKYGVCIRNVNDNIEKLATIGNKVLSFPADRLEEIAEEYHATGSNNGNFSEYLLSGNIKDIIDRFRAKRNDVYIKLEPFKTKRAWELKTTLKYTNKGKKSSASNTNFLYHEKIKK